MASVSEDLVVVGVVADEQTSGVVARSWPSPSRRTWPGMRPPPSPSPVEVAGAGAGVSILSAVDRRVRRPRPLVRLVVASVVLAVVVVCGATASSRLASPSLDGTAAAPAPRAVAVSRATGATPAVEAMAAAVHQVFAGPSGDAVVASVEAAAADPQSGVSPDAAAMVRFVHDQADALTADATGDDVAASTSAGTSAETPGSDVDALLRAQPWYQRLATTGRSAKQDPAVVIDGYWRLAALRTWAPKADPGSDPVDVAVRAAVDHAREEPAVAHLRSELAEGLPWWFDASAVAGLDDLGVGLVASPAMLVVRASACGTRAGVVASVDVDGGVALAAAGVLLHDLRAGRPGSGPFDRAAAGVGLVQLYLTSFAGPVGSSWAGGDRVGAIESCRAHRPSASAGPLGPPLP